ncbi:hypothetical protein cypCar_00018643 [Cyprinus carpio]|nr:hypothetical protein cypCar_00018643 [Cyprinus carpio]
MAQTVTMTQGTRDIQIVNDSRNCVRSTLYAQIRYDKACEYWYFATPYTYPLTDFEALMNGRKGSKGKDPGSNIQNLKPDCIAEPRQRFATGGFSWWTILCLMTGSIVGISLGLLCCIYVSTLHENDLWFSNIKEVEREISFRTECGLYYSYYKQMLKAPSIQQGTEIYSQDRFTGYKVTLASYHFSYGTLC